MTAASTLKTWYWLHKWSSLVSTLFLLIICVTGLPLVFHDEIDQWLDGGKPYAVAPADAPAASIDPMVAKARELYPGQVITFVFADDDQPQVLVGMAPSFAKAAAESHTLKFDAHTGELLKDGRPGQRFTFMGIMLALHMDLYAGLPGELFLGFMGLLFVIAIVSGVMLYGPFMKKLAFGTVRAGRSRRLKWLDLHNLLGAVTLGWGLVVGVTGVINELSTPMFAYWQKTDVAQLLAAYKNAAAPVALTSAQAAREAAMRALPGDSFVSLTFPGNEFGVPHHYMVWAKGSTPLRSHLFTAALVDAGTGQLTAVARPPWYLAALELSRPLHFGDYGGMPLKMIWALLDLITIVVLASGLYLWFARRRATDARVAALARQVPIAAPVPAKAS